MAISYRSAQGLIKRGADDNLRAALDGGLDPNLTNENGWSLLMLAAVEGSESLAQLLLERGADAGKINAKGETAEGIAAKRGFLELATRLQTSTKK